MNFIDNARKLVRPEDNHYLTHLGILDRFIVFTFLLFNFVGTIAALNEFGTLQPLTHPIVLGLSITDLLLFLLMTFLLMPVIGIAEKILVRSAHIVYKRVRA